MGPHRALTWCLRADPSLHCPHQAQRSPSTRPSHPGPTCTGNSPSSTTASCPPGLRALTCWLPTPQVPSLRTECPSRWPQHCPQASPLGPPAPFPAHGWYVPLLPWREEGPGSWEMGWDGMKREKPSLLRPGYIPGLWGRYSSRDHFTEEEVGRLGPGPSPSHAPSVLELVLTDCVWWVLETGL